MFTGPYDWSGGERPDRESNLRVEPHQTSVLVGMALLAIVLGVCAMFGATAFGVAYFAAEGASIYIESKAP